MDRNEFELMFSQDNEADLDWFHRVGMFAVPCDCARPYCKDWRIDSILNMSVEQIDQIPLEDLAAWISFSLGYRHGKESDDDEGGEDTTPAV